MLYNYVNQMQEQLDQQSKLTVTTRETLDEMLRTTVKELPFTQEVKDYTLQVFAGLLDDYRDNCALFGEIKSKLEVAENDPAWNE